MIITLGGGHENQRDSKASKQTIQRLFHVFDINNDGIIDFYELASGISILCAGSKSSKVSASFALFDRNGDGKISLNEMIIYLTSVFRVIFEATPYSAEEFGATPEELAESTAFQCFEDCDINKDGFLSLEEFTVWYESSM